MLELNKIYNEDCLITLDKMNESGIKVNVVLTSPPYNTSTGVNCKDPYHKRYNGNYKDLKTDEEYVNWITNIFNKIDNVLESNGVILFNISYSARKSSLYIRVLNDIICNTPFDIMDTMIWKKKSALPDNSSPNRLSRITEFVFIIARKNESKTFQSNKEFLYKKGHLSFYQPILNFVEAPNNDKSTNLNKATYSSELCEKLLSIYAKENDIVYDTFMGTGTTAIGAIRKKCRYIGSEIDSEQVEYSNERIKNEEQ